MGVYLQAIREVLEFSNELRDRLGVAIRFFDFGGGFGVPTVRPYSAADMRLIANGYPPRAIEVDATPRIESYGSRIADLFLKYRPPTGHEDPIVIFEPGRSVTSAAQTLLLRAIAIKPRPDLGRNVILDGGKNVAMPPGWEFHEVFAASRMDQAHGELHDLFGPLCHPGDVVCANKRLPPLAPGDVVAVMDTGAYFVPNQMNFSNPRCGAVLVENGEARMIRNHESFEEVVQRDFLAESAP